MSNTSDLVTLAVMILLPMIPAIVLFKALPSTADVGGPFQGQTIKLGGAFAGYFAVLLLVFMTRDAWSPPRPASAYQVWQVDGALVDENGTPVNVLSADQVQVSPATFSNVGGGRFEITIVTHPGPTGKALFPTLSINYQDQQYMEVPVSFDDDSAVSGQGDIHLTRDLDNHVIKIAEPIRLKKFPAYTGGGTPPVAVPAETKP